MREGEIMRPIIMPAAILLALAACASAGRGHPAPNSRAVLPAPEESSPVRLSDEDRRAVERDLRSALQRLAPTEADSARGCQALCTDGGSSCSTSLGSLRSISRSMSA